MFPSRFLNLSLLSQKSRQQKQCPWKSQIPFLAQWLFDRLQSWWSSSPPHVPQAWRVAWACWLPKPNKPASKLDNLTMLGRTAGQSCTSTGGTQGLDSFFSNVGLSLPICLTVLAEMHYFELLRTVRLFVIFCSLSNVQFIYLLEHSRDCNV